MKISPRVASTSFALGCVLTTTLSWADSGAAEGAKRAVDAPYARRGGFTAGLSLGGSIGSTAGYPNDSRKVGYEPWYTQTGITLGTGGLLWFGVAMTDYLAFDLALESAKRSRAEDVTELVAFLFRIESYPAYGLGGAFRDLGVSFQAGTGSLTVKSPSETLIDGGAPSRVGFGVFYEWLRWKNLTLGPTSSFDYSFSDTARSPSFFIGLRSAVYAKP